MEIPTDHFVALLHGIEWKYPEATEFLLSEGIKLCKFKGSYAENIYFKLCNENGLDDGDGFEYETYISIGLRSDPEHLPHEQGPDSTISRICNVIAITINGPISWYRLIGVTKNLNFSGYTYDIGFSNTAEQFDNQRGNLTIESLDLIKRLWISDRMLRENYISNSRIINSLDYYFYAWRAWNLDQTCINLAIVLETLFSPSSNAELSHRIAYNSCRFMGTDKTNRQYIYNMLKKYYRLRSQIVHGEQPKYELLIEQIPEVLLFCSNVLKRILLDKDLMETFNNNAKRQEFFNSWLFD